MNNNNFIRVSSGDLSFTKTIQFGRGVDDNIKYTFRFVHNIFYGKLGKVMLLVNKTTYLINNNPNINPSNKFCAESG